MGIAGFQRWLLGSFPEVARIQGARFGQVYDHVAFDMNQIIHQASRRARDRQSLAAAIFREVDQILKNCVPRKSIFFAFDGPGPLAKLMTQRKRRNRTKKDHTDVKDGEGKRAKYAKPAIDRLQCTPGVELLYFLRDATEYWAFSRLQNDRKYRNIDIRVSGSDVAGEGELKLIDFCRAGQLPATDSVVVVGGDADIVLQGLATVPVRNFFVYLRNFEGKGKNRVNYVVSVWELCRILERLFPGESFGVRIDFILFSILNGNDYVPKIRGVTLSRLWRRYLELKSTSGEKGLFHGQCVVDAERRSFNWPFFHALINKVGVPVRSLELEPSLPITNYVGNVPNEANMFNEQGKHQTMVENENDEEGDRILYTGNEDGVPIDQVAGFSDSDPDDEDENTDLAGVDGEGEEEEEEEEEVIDEDAAHIESLVRISGDASKFYDTERWFRTLLWTLHMYIDGYCGDYYFQYGKPYGPSCDVLVKYIEDHNGDPFVLQAPVSSEPPLRPHQAAVAMLPKHASHYLPKPLRPLLEDPAISKTIFLPNDVVNVPAMIRAIDSIPRSAYSQEELARTVPGRPFLLRRPRAGDPIRRANPRIPKPGVKFAEIAAQPYILRKFFEITKIPPCYPWPRGSLRNLLELPFVEVGGERLKRPTKQPTAPKPSSETGSHPTAPSATSQPPKGAVRKVRTVAKARAHSQPAQKASGSSRERVNGSRPRRSGDRSSKPTTPQASRESK